MVWIWAVARHGVRQPYMIKKGNSMVLEVGEKNGRKYTLFLDGERYCRCYPGDLRAFGFSDFSDGQENEVTEDVLDELERTVFLPRAKRRSLMLLGKKEYTERELVKKLTGDGYPERVTATVLSWLSELHYVDDSSFSERYAFSLLSRHSEREIIQKMQQKGFEKDLIKEALAAAKERYREEQSVGNADMSSDERTVDFSTEQEAIRTFLRKKGYRPEATDSDKKKKLMMSLYRKGFSMSNIRAVLGEPEGEYEY